MSRIGGVGRNKSPVRGGQQEIRMNFEAELADSNLTLIYASAAAASSRENSYPTGRGWVLATLPPRPFGEGMTLLIRGSKS